MEAIEATAGFEAVVAAGLVGAGLPDDLQSEKGVQALRGLQPIKARQPTIQRRSERGGWGITSVPPTHVMHERT